MVTMENIENNQVGVRLPPGLLRWVRSKIHSPKNPRGEYKTISQALTGELLKAKTYEDLGLISQQRPSLTRSPEDDVAYPRGEICNETR